MREVIRFIVAHELGVFILVAAIVFALILTTECSPPVLAAPRRPVPVGQWDPATRVWLARGLVGEAGWKAETDHAAIAWVLARRWEAMRRRWPHLRFRDVVFRYVKALGVNRREYTPRQLWVRGLGVDGTEPPGWPGNVSWERHRPLWAAALRRVDDWQRGRLRDPCAGRADHWGGTIDVPWEGLVPVDCGDTRNSFYRVSVDREGIARAGGATIP